MGYSFTNSILSFIKKVVSLDNFKKRVRSILVEDLVAGHHGYEVFGIRQIDDVMRPAWDHVNGFDFVARNFELNEFSGIDVSFLNKTASGNHDELFPFGVVPMVAFGDTGF